MEDNRKTNIKANIRNKITEVVAVSEKRDEKSYCNLTYVGYGQYHSIDGKATSDKKFYHLWA